MRPPDLNVMVAFDAPANIPDGSGGTEIGWTDDRQSVRAWAGFRFLRGGETVQAARLSGRQPAVVTIYATPDTRRINASWRMRDLDRGGEYNVRTAIPAEDPLYLELTVESGVAL